MATRHQPARSRDGSASVGGTARIGAWIGQNNATKTACTKIFGKTPGDALVDILIDPARLQFFDSFSHDGPTGIGTKAAMAGWLIAVSVIEDVDLYAKANDAFIADLLAQKVDFGIDIVGQYGKPEYGLF